MPLPPICRAAAFAACLALALPAWGDEHETASPDASDAAGEAAGTDAAAPADTAGEAAAPGGVADARALIEAGRFGEALAILAPLVQGDTVEANAIFLYGLAAMGAAQLPDVPGETRERLLDEAIGAFRTMLIEEPRLLRVRLELARAFYLKGEDDLARRHFEIVLAAEPPEAVVANVTSFLSSIRARRRWRFSLGAALAPDSNIGGTSEERIIYIFDLPFRRNVEELTTSGIGVSLWGGAEYHYPVLDDLRIRAGAQFARREYERSQFDQLFVGTHLGPRWLLDRDTELSVLGSARQRWVGTAPDDRELGGRFEVAHRISQRVTVAGQASWHGRRYRVRTNFDGPILDASVRTSWVVDPTVRLEFSGGYGRHRPKRLSHRNRARWLGTGVSVILPLGFTVGAGAEVRWTDYNPGWWPHVRDGTGRTDRTRSLRASVHHRGFTVFGFSPELVVVDEKRETNAQLYDFERTRGELRFVQQF
ncbi:MAG: porin family protein [Alphaproteobacteria bacterium]|nr:porin family protein [Alphaproteobacteria bacterium]